MQSTFGNSSIRRQEYLKKWIKQLNCISNLQLRHQTIFLYWKKRIKHPWNFPQHKKHHQFWLQVQVRQQFCICWCFWIQGWGKLQKSYWMDLFPIIFVESQRNYLAFMSALQKIKLIQSLLQPGTHLFLMQKRLLLNAVVHYQALWMSLHEIPSKWSGQYNYHNLVTNYKRLKKKSRLNQVYREKIPTIPTKISWILKFSIKNLPENKMFQKSFCMIQWFQRNYLNGTLNLAFLLVFFTSFTWCLIQ